MYSEISKYIVQLFGLFFIAVGLFMLSKPITARAFLRKSGSTNLINYTEITLRMIPAIGLILASSMSKFSNLLLVFGWFMLGTSLVLYFVPRNLHHNFSNKAADFLKPQYFLLIAPFSIAIGFFLFLGLW